MGHERIIQEEEAQILAAKPVVGALPLYIEAEVLEKCRDGSGAEES